MSLSVTVTYQVRKIFMMSAAALMVLAANSCTRDNGLAALGTDGGPLRIGILGDSISTYEGYIDNSYKSYYPREEVRDGELVGSDVDDWTKTYWGILLEEYWNAELDVNASWSGTCITPRAGFNSDFLARAKTFIDPDIIIVNGGTNDYLKGKKGDGVVTPEKFRTAYENLLDILKASYPQAQVMIVVGDFVKSDYGDISVETADKYNLPCIDFRPYTKSIGKVFNDRSNPHPNAAGMRFMAEKIYDQTKSIVDNLNK